MNECWKIKATQTSVGGSIQTIIEKVIPTWTSVREERPTHKSVGTQY